jgi:hypothetical protein
MMETV